MQNGNIPILGNGSAKPHRPGEVYIPGQTYELVVEVMGGGQLTVHVGLNLPPDKIPNPFVPEELMAKWVGAQRVQESVSRSQEGIWFFWQAVSCWKYMGRVPTVVPGTDR